VEVGTAARRAAMEVGGQIFMATDRKENPKEGLAIG